MTRHIEKGPIDALGEAYNNMYEHVAANIHKITDKTGPVLHDLIDEAREKGNELDDLTEEEIKNISVWLKRDLDEALNYLAETEYAVRDWLGFETSLIKNTVIRMMLESADKTTVELLRMKENSHKPFDYHTGEMTGFGTLICDECGEKLHFHQPGHIPPCPKCHKTSFHRIQID